MFDNHYDCPRCGTAWTDTWSAQCDDDCPNCGLRHISPSSSDDAGDEADDEGIDGEDNGPCGTPPVVASCSQI